jgi:hypothetical protein
VRALGQFVVGTAGGEVAQAISIFLLANSIGVVYYFLGNPARRSCAAALLPLFVLRTTFPALDERRSSHLLESITYELIVSIPLIRDSTQPLAVTPLESTLTKVYETNEFKYL